MPLALDLGCAEEEGFLVQHGVAATTEMLLPASVPGTGLSPPQLVVGMMHTFEILE